MEFPLKSIKISAQYVWIMILSVHCNKTTPSCVAGQLSARTAFDDHFWVFFEDDIVIVVVIEDRDGEEVLRGTARRWGRKVPSLVAPSTCKIKVN